MDFRDWMEGISRAFEIVGVAILLVGSVLAFGRFLSTKAWNESGYRRLRVDLGRAILLGLEILVAADIIRTVAVDQTLQSALTLGIIVAVRTFLSFSLEIELEGTLPWRKAAGPTGRA